ncbi:hypothetical protein A2811_01650 [Candidatus Campbellbacteria bacterium RIFCSPHIGHO2_01_FULL_34_10]|uniref:Uncharacterized protein n=1 Tax=Candidatus Campbellbacteria bacterium RIFCSPHIGHO2_01_FULL_34_10 TaxID=1797577 RepID=A0A1F5EQD2_9BACT|nr:MAG: hypothetical protein A2811_01650 [Candidatus Campbellbacteria bacterium RIFCSPHIGHO2_01_FULL_34_10]
MKVNTSRITEIFNVTVDETKTVEELVADGNYCSNYNCDIKNFLDCSNGDKKAAIKNMAIFHFKGAVTTTGVFDLMEKEGYRPATVHELLSLGMEPEYQREFMIIALGFKPLLRLGGYECRYALYLYDANCLGIVPTEGRFLDHCRFAGVRKQVY